MQWSRIIDGFAQMAAPGHVELIVIIIAGLALWLLGRKLARPAGAISGMIVGGAAALAASQSVGDRGLLLVWMVVGCIIGAVLAWLLFRVWMGLAAAVILGLAMPTAVILWHGPPPPQADDAATESALVEPAALDAEPNDPQPVDEQPQGEPSEDGPTDEAQDEAPLDDNAVRELQRQLRDKYEKETARARAWWNELPEARQQMITYSGAGGAAIGLLVGLAWPYLAATLLSALIGSAMVLGAAKRFIELYAEDAEAWVPQRLAVQLTILGLITVLGVLVQWTIFRGEADK